MVLSSTLTFRADSAATMSRSATRVPVGQTPQCSPLDAIGEPPPLTPIYKTKARPSSASSPSSQPTTPAIVIPVAHRPVLPVVFTDNGRMITADHAVSRSGSSAFTTVADMTQPLPNGRTPYTLSVTKGFRFSPYAASTRPQNCDTHPDMLVRASLTTRQRLTEFESRRKWQAVQAFLRRTQGSRAATQASSSRRSVQKMHVAELEARLLQKQLLESPQSLARAVVATSQKEQLHQSPPSITSPSQRTPGTDTDCFGHPAYIRSQRCSSGSEISSDDSSEHENEDVMDFSHSLQPVDVDDGFDAERARHLQSQVCDDPSVRTLPSGTHVFGCRRCQKTFMWRRHLEEHFFVHQSRDKSALCHVCGKCFTRADHLNRHASSAHQRSTIICQICGEVFSRASHLNRHWRSSHSKRQEKKERLPLLTSTGPVSAGVTLNVASRSHSQRPAVRVSDWQSPTETKELRQGHRALLTNLFTKHRTQSTPRLRSPGDREVSANGGYENVRTAPPPLSIFAADHSSDSDSDVEDSRPEGHLVIDLDDGPDVDGGSD